MAHRRTNRIIAAPLEDKKQNKTKQNKTKGVRLTKQNGEKLRQTWQRGGQIVGFYDTKQTERTEREEGERTARQERARGAKKKKMKREREERKQILQRAKTKKMQHKFTELTWRKGGRSSARAAEIKTWKRKRKMPKNETLISNLCCWKKDERKLLCFLKTVKCFERLWVAQLGGVSLCGAIAPCLRN